MNFVNSLITISDFSLWSPLGMFVSIYLQMLLKHANFCKCVLNIRLIKDLFIGHELWRKNTNDISQNNTIFTINFILLARQMALEICRYTLGYICKAFSSVTEFILLQYKLSDHLNLDEGQRKWIFQFSNFKADRPQNATPDSSFEMKRIWARSHKSVS